MSLPALCVGAVSGEICVVFRGTAHTHWTVSMADKAVTIRTRKFMTNRLLSRKQFVSFPFFSTNLHLITWNITFPVIFDYFSALFFNSRILSECYAFSLMSCSWISLGRTEFCFLRGSMQLLLLLLELFGSENLIGIVWFSLANRCFCFLSCYMKFEGFFPNCSVRDS